MKLPEPNHDGQVYAGTCGGMFLSIFSNMFIEDLVRTVILAFVGAVVSFGVSLVLKSLIKRKKRPPTSVS
jgi:ABC-type lipoprotein release transport system permease subunit